jgi:hypothetical protein
MSAPGRKMTNLVNSKSLPARHGTVLTIRPLGNANDLKESTKQLLLLNLEDGAQATTGRLTEKLALEAHQNTLSIARSSVPARPPLPEKTKNSASIKRLQQEVKSLAAPSLAYDLPERKAKPDQKFTVSLLTQAWEAQIHAQDFSRPDTAVSSTTMDATKVRKRSASELGITTTPPSLHTPSQHTKRAEIDEQWQSHPAANPTAPS